MWILKLSLATTWMTGMVMGWTLNGLWNLLALAVVVLVFAEGTAIERRIVRVAAALAHRAHLATAVR